jgi:hypothetical protein
MKNMYKILMTLAVLIFMSGGLFAQESITIKKQPMGITIDGVGDETAWENATAYEVKNFLGDAPDDEFDFSATFKVAWNDTALFFLVSANDFDIYPVDNWWADGMEFYFQFGDGEATGDNIFDDRPNGFFQVAVRLNNEPATGGYFPDSTQNDAVTVIDEGAGAWITEGYMAWGQFNDNNEDPITPAADYTFKFDVNVGDNDIGEGSGANNNYWSSTTHLWTGDYSTAGIATLSDEVLDPDAVVGIDKIMQASFDIYPNPASSVLYFEENVDAVRIYSIVGKNVLSKSLQNTNSVIVSELSRGIYFINFYSDNEYIGTRKFMVK